MKTNQGTQPAEGEITTFQHFNGCRPEMFSDSCFENFRNIQRQASA